MIEKITLYSGTLLILLGFITGILSGFFGVGGCFILTPLLNVLGLPMANAVGTSLFFAVIVSLLGGIKHYLIGNVLISISIIMYYGFVQLCWYTVFPTLSALSG